MPSSTLGHHTAQGTNYLHINIMKIQDLTQNHPNTDITFVDTNDQELEVTHVLKLLNPNTEEVKEIRVILKPHNTGENIINIDIFFGICDLAINWKSIRKKFYHWACETQQIDARWKEEWFREHMYHEWIMTECPITDRIHSLDHMNMIVLLSFIKNEYDSWHTSPLTF